MSDSRRRRNRPRGTIYVACAAEGERVWAVHVTPDLIGACAALAGVPDGYLHAIAPGEGAPWRKYLAGGPPPVVGVAISNRAETFVTYVADKADVSERTARPLRAEGNPQGRRRRRPTVRRRAWWQFRTEGAIRREVPAPHGLAGLTHGRFLVRCGLRVACGHVLRVRPQIWSIRAWDSARDRLPSESRGNRQSGTQLGRGAHGGRFGRDLPAGG